ncbi:uncharacterized protein TRIADDRAFT_22725 [Trichoplax adhaerens]|uniref:Amino acid transporter transmembrane domain-containing protein n=1 Tax=Trichoplax adhaerens TaxID=10228 RepID=B3RRJ6_TRIAD|nr:hypothetical protein TRIADDRAFT_22725 [Trichoplax adhaerens]EDV26356.1 hypothetical protein TRIADDRAFT_22725 [Trichoplax adhaerens]|eukprot:XP_002110352.1 hypothetical protein TRIADDRAFT_22725 [Trichoplax adhaerens]
MNVIVPPTEIAKGIGVATTAFFIVAEMAGSGVLALPKAVVESGYTGIGLIVVASIMSAYTGKILGDCWNILLDKLPQYREHNRYPYPSIGYEAIGPAGRYLVSICVNLTLFGVGVVFLILASNNLISLIDTHNISYAGWLAICAAFVTPLMWFGTPKDFWFIGILSAACTITAVILIFINLMLIAPAPQDLASVPQAPVTFTSFFFAFGAILFAYGGHAAFPTVQHDMREPSKFKQSILISYTTVNCLYLPIAIAGFLIFGRNAETADILLTLKKSGRGGAILAIAEVLITLHALFGFIIVQNPLAQEIENIFKVPNKFCWQRVVLRTIQVGAVLGLAEAVPKFGAVLSLIGGSTVTALTFIFPSLFYLILKKKLARKPISLVEYTINIELIAIGFLGGIASTYSAIIGIGKAFAPK